MFKSSIDDKAIALLTEYKSHLDAEGKPHEIIAALEQIIRDFMRPEKFPKTEQMRAVFDSCAKWLEQQKRLDDVKIVFELCYREWPLDERAAYNYGVALLEVEEYEEAAKFLKTIIRDGISIWDTPKMLNKRAAYLWNFRKDCQEAYELLTKAHKLDPGDLTIEKNLNLLLKQHYVIFII